MSKKFNSTAALVAVVERLPLVIQYFSSAPLTKEDKRRPGWTFTTLGTNFGGNTAEAERQLRQVATFARVGKNKADKPSTIAVFAASPEVVMEAAATIGYNRAVEIAREDPQEWLQDVDECSVGADLYRHQQGIQEYYLQYAIALVLVGEEQDGREMFFRVFAKGMKGEKVGKSPCVQPRFFLRELASA